MLFISHSFWFFKDDKTVGENDVSISLTLLFGTLCAVTTRTMYSEIKLLKPDSYKIVKI